jgi:hypothetical protein
VISVDASEHRAHAATKAGVLSAALDAAASAGAETSLEKMLAHQVAAAHHAGMELLGRVAEDGGLGPSLPPVERARLTNAAARLFEVAQGGCLTLQRMKTAASKPSSCSTSPSASSARPWSRGVSTGAGGAGARRRNRRWSLYSYARRRGAGHARGRAYPVRRRRCPTADVGCTGARAPGCGHQRASSGAGGRGGNTVPVHARCGSTSGPRGRVFEPFGRSWRNTVPAAWSQRLPKPRNGRAERLHVRVSAARSLGGGCSIR